MFAVDMTYYSLRLDFFDGFYVSSRLQFSLSNEESSAEVAAMEVLQVLEVRVKINKVDGAADEDAREDHDQNGQSLLRRSHVLP